jgi:cation diffusion facilitator family transporter
VPEDVGEAKVFSTKAGATKLLIGVVVTLIAIKVLVGLLTGSISVLAQAADSLLDLFAGIITFSAVRIAAKPADAEHPYGHGKAEDIAGAGQGILILVAGGLIIYSAVVRIQTGQYRVEQPVAGIVVPPMSTPRQPYWSA